MLKKIFVAIFGLLILSSQTAAAVDWNSVPHFDNKAELARYIENGRRQGQTVFNFVLTNRTFSTNKEVAEKEAAALAEEFTNGVAFALKSNMVVGMGTGRVTYTITKEYPGTRVANAYLNGGTLSGDDWILYQKALPIVNEAKKFSSPIDRELYIHDEIIRRVDTFYNDETFFTEDNDNRRFITAMGVLIDGKANCQGFADTFYMLCRMTGLDVGRIGGTFGTASHVWNTITFEDGKTYCVDVTNGFNTKSLYLFNAPLEIIQRSHSCQWDAIPNLQQTADGRYGGNLK